MKIIRQVQNVFVYFNSFHPNSSRQKCEMWAVDSRDDKLLNDTGQQTIRATRRQTEFFKVESASLTALPAKLVLHRRLAAHFTAQWVTREGGGRVPKSRLRDCTATIYRDSRVVSVTRHVNSIRKCCDGCRRVAGRCLSSARQRRR